MSHDCYERTNLRLMKRRKLDLSGFSAIAIPKIYQRHENIEYATTGRPGYAPLYRHEQSEKHMMKHVLVISAELTLARTCSMPDLLGVCNLKLDLRDGDSYQ